MKEITLGNLFLWTDFLSIIIWALTLFLAFRFGKREGVLAEKERRLIQWVKEQMGYDE